MLSGIIGNMVLRTLDNQQIAQAAPAEVKQTKSTQESGTEFRQCSKWGRYLRDYWKPFLDGETDSYMHRRWTTALYQAILSNTSMPKGLRTPLTCDMKSTEGFEFNINSPFKTYFKSEISVLQLNDGRIELTVPSFVPNEALEFPKGIFEAELILYVFATKLLPNETNLTANFVMPLQKTATPTVETTYVSEAIPAGYWVLVLAKLQFFTINAFIGKKYENSKTLSPTQLLFAETSL